MAKEGWPLACPKICHNVLIFVLFKPIGLYRNINTHTNFLTPPTYFDPPTMPKFQWAFMVPQTPIGLQSMKILIIWRIFGHASGHHNIIFKLFHIIHIILYLKKVIFMFIIFKRHIIQASIAQRMMQVDLTDYSVLNSSARDAGRLDNNSAGDLNRYFSHPAKHQHCIVVLFQ